MDRSLGVEPIRTELWNAGLRIEIHDDHFDRDEEDRIWLQNVGERGWVILTKDQRLRYRPLEIAAVFVAALPRIQKILLTHAGPFVARVSQSGHVAMAF